MEFKKKKAVDARCRVYLIEKAEAERDQKLALH
jgi:hypothetical protein